MDKVIIALSHNPANSCSFSYAQLHVAMSRVRRKDDIRLFLNGISDAEKWRSIQYIFSLQPESSIEFFFDGFRSRQGDNANFDWKNDAWNLAKANAAYESKHPNLWPLQQKRARKKARRSFLQKKLRAQLPTSSPANHTNARRSEIDSHQQYTPSIPSDITNPYSP